MTESPSSTPADRYAARGREHEALARRLAARADRYSWLRLALFVAGLLVGLGGLAATDAGTAVYAVLLVMVVIAFTAAARAHRRAERGARWHGALAAVCTEAQARLHRDWAALPQTVAPRVGADHPYSADLDVLGTSSLLQLLGPLGAATGGETAARWLLEGAPPAEVRRRQAAVLELRPLEELREELAARSRLTGSARAGDVQRFLAWAESEPWLAQRPSLALLRWLVPALWLAAGLAATLGGSGAGAYSLPLVVGIVVATISGRRVPRLLGRAAPGSDTFRLFSDQFALLLRHDAQSDALRDIQAVLLAGRLAAPLALRRLRRTLDASELRYSPLLHSVVNVLTAWDLHVLTALERWQVESGRAARSWFNALGEAEAIAGFATLWADHPDWVLPEVAEQEMTFQAAALGHPLLPPASCVRNDVEVGPPGTFLFVTGSNMAGKSTLLRAIGTNAVLALAGAPVCAARLRLPPVALLTSMRVTDSLAAGISFFMAELLRLKSVVHSARAASNGAAPGGEAPGDAPPRALYLLDEILQGTNSAERQVAARRIVQHLLEVGAIGAVSTHDLGLADTPALGPAARAVHFRETLSADGTAPAMTFDYRLRPGPATSANALRLVEMIGLG